MEPKSLEKLIFELQPVHNGTSVGTGLSTGKVSLGFLVTLCTSFPYHFVMSFHLLPQVTLAEHDCHLGSASSLYGASGVPALGFILLL